MFCDDIINGRVLLKLGSSGSYVRTLQTALRKIGYPITISGNYDLRTKNYVKDYQSAHSLHVDGIVGKHTATSLCSLGLLQDILQAPTQYTYPPVKTKTGNIPLPTVTGIKGIDLQSIPTWVWYMIIGGGIILMMGGNK